MHGVHDVGASGDRADRQTAADGLRRRHEVGHDVLVLDRVPAAGASIADWISSAMKTMPFAPRTPRCPATKPGAGTMNPPSPWIGSMIRRRCSLRRCACASRRARRRGRTRRRSRGAAGRAAVRVGERQAVDLRRERPHALLVRHHLGRERHRHQRAPVERVVEHHDRRAARVLARDLHGVLDGLGAGVREHRLLLVVAGVERVQPLGELDVGLVRRDVEARVRVELEPASGRARRPRARCGRR